MTALEIAMRFPLMWPEGRPMTFPSERKPALFQHDGSPLTFEQGRTRIRDQLGAMTRSGQAWRTTNVVLSCNIRFTLSGARDQSRSRRDPGEQGVALYFDLDGSSHVLACDRWDTVADNAAAIAAHIEALRGQERWGVGDLRQAFAGHAALPPPVPWWEVLGVAADAPIEVITAAYRALARKHHPDASGDRAEWDRLSAAHDAAKAARS